MLMLTDSVVPDNIPSRTAVPSEQLPVLSSPLRGDWWVERGERLAIAVPRVGAGCRWSIRSKGFEWSLPR